MDARDFGPGRRRVSTQERLISVGDSEGGGCEHRRRLPGHGSARRGAARCSRSPRSVGDGERGGREAPGRGEKALARMWRVPSPRPSLRSGPPLSPFFERGEGTGSFAASLLANVASQQGGGSRRPGLAGLVGPSRSRPCSSRCISRSLGSPGILLGRGKSLGSELPSSRRPSAPSVFIVGRGRDSVRHNAPSPRRLTL